MLVSLERTSLYHVQYWSCFSTLALLHACYKSAGIMKPADMNGPLLKAAFTITAAATASLLHFSVLLYLRVWVK